MIDHKRSKNKGFRYKFVILDNFSKYLWAIPLKKEKSKTIAEEFSKILTTSKKSLIKLESDRGAKFYNPILKTCLIVKVYNITLHSQTKVSQ